MEKYMERYKETVSMLLQDAANLFCSLEKLKSSNSQSASVIEKDIDDYLCELEVLCLKSRVLLDGYKQVQVVSDSYTTNTVVSEIAGEIEVTHDGWLHIRLNTLLPNCKYRISNYIGDTISRLIASYAGELPFFGKAFLAIVEQCNNENHNALDNDNKGWKMIPNALKGRVIEDDSQFILSIGLFSEISEEARCDIYVMPPEDGSIFMDLLAQNEL